MYLCSVIQKSHAAIVMKVLHILPNERTADILRRAGVPTENIYAFPALLAETDRYLWEYHVPNELEKYDKIIVWHGNDTNSLLLLALFGTLKLPLWHIDACKHKRLLRKYHIIKNRKSRIINMVTMSEMGVRLLYGKEKPVRWWQTFRHKRLWRFALEQSDALFLQDKRGLYRLDKSYVYDFCLLSISENFQPMTKAITGIMIDLAEIHCYVSEQLIAKCIDELVLLGAVEKRPTQNRAKEKLGHLTDVNYEIRNIESVNQQEDEKH